MMILWLKKQCIFELSNLFQLSINIIDNLKFMNLTHILWETSIHIKAMQLYLVKNIMITLRFILIIFLRNMKEQINLINSLIYILVRLFIVK
jgi:hypothetical protein